MSDLIDAACDICGRQYRWPDERLGETATCRYCGTKFEVKVFVAPEEDSHAKDLQWFKGVGVAILVLAVVVGLSSLLVLRPAGSGSNVAGDSWRSRQNNSFPSAPSSPVGHQHFNPADDIRSRLDQRGRGIGGQPAMGNPVNPIPVVTHGNTPAAPFAMIAPDATPLHPATSAPVVTEWGFVGEFPHRKIQMKGTGLQGLTKFQVFFGSGLIDAKCNQVSDTLLETDGIFVNSREVTMYVITNSLGVAVAFSDDIPTVNTLKPLPRRRADNEPRLYLVISGGQLLSERPTNVLVDDGGIATVNPWTHFAIVKRSGELQTETYRNTIMEAGARVTSKRSHINDRTNLISVPALAFCRLPVISEK